jgi:hypothetical protein
MLVMMIGSVGRGLVRRICEDLVERRKVRRSREARQEVLVLCQPKLFPFSWVWIDTV